MSHDKENKKQQSSPADTSKGQRKDISNDMEKNAQGDKGGNNYTPQNRTDNEQDEEKKK
ncbi:hypothetical protein [Pontibacter beigongshangensis]|uniref:hypothetical protein n=1 Tax=Pontibacter beigongshangensis TaxID=2574733 RepID=UPI00164F034E|nr:hypothetical protein [Pontibacter beigongshangensis]